MCYRLLMYNLAIYLYDDKGDSFSTSPKQSTFMPNTEPSQSERLTPDDEPSAPERAVSTPRPQSSCGD